MKVFLTRLDGHAVDPEERDVVSQELLARGCEVIVPSPHGSLVVDPIKRADVIIAQISLGARDLTQLLSLYMHIAQENSKPTLLLVPDVISLEKDGLPRMLNKWARCESYWTGDSLRHKVDCFLDECAVWLSEGVVVQETMFGLQAGQERK